MMQWQRHVFRISPLTSVRAEGSKTLAVTQHCTIRELNSSKTVLPSSSHLALFGRSSSLTKSLTSNLHRDNRVREFSIGRRDDASIDDEFQAAQQRLGTLTEDPGNMVKLQIYGLFKQVMFMF